MAGRLRLARLDVSGYTPAAEAGAPSVATHRRLDALIRRHLPPVTASLLAQPSPTTDDQTIEWYSDLAGQPVALTSLPAATQQHARDLLHNRLQSLADLADRLAQLDPAGAADLRHALSFPSENTVYVVGGQPVITCWGYQPIGTPAFTPGVAPTSASSSPAVTAAADSAGSATATADVLASTDAAGAEHRRSRRWPWLLLLVLLPFIAAFTLHQFFGWGWRWPPWGPDFAALLRVASDDARALRAREASLEQLLASRVDTCRNSSALAAAQIEGARLAGEIGALERRLQEALALCPQRKQLDDAHATGNDLAKQVAGLEKRLAKSLDDCRQRQAAAKRQEEAAARRTAEAQQRPTQVAAATSPPAPTQSVARPASTRPDGRPACPGERPPEEAPDIAIVLDASGSMRLPASMMAAQIEDELGRLGGVVELLGTVIMMGAGGPSRLDEAKRGINSVVGSLPEDVDVGMAVLADCPRAHNLGFFSPAQRGQLRARVDALQPMQGTPLAEGTEQAGNMVDGVKVPGVIVVISDGKDSCGGDPCAAARNLKARKPLLTINVVDIIGNGALSCMATATGGKVLKPGDGLAFERTIREAAGPAMKPDYCP